MTVQPRERRHPSARDVDTHALAAALTASCAARSTSAPARGPRTRPTPRTSARCRSAWSRLATSTTWRPCTRSAASYGAPLTLRGGGTSLAGQATATLRSCSTRRGTSPGCCRSTPTAVGLGRARSGHRRPPRRRRETRTHLRARPRDGRSLHASAATSATTPAAPTRCMAGKTVDNVEALDMLLYDGTRLTVGADHRRGARRDRRGRRPPRRDLRGAALAARRYGDRIRPASRSIPRRVSGYNLDALLPGARLQRGARAGRQRGHLRRRSSRRGAAGRRARRAGRWWCSATPTSTRAADHVPRGARAWARSASRARRRADRRHAAQGRSAADWRCCPTARLAARRVRRRHREEAPTRRPRA